MGFIPDNGKYLGEYGLEKLITLIKTEDKKKLEGVQVNGTDLAISSAKVNIPLASSSVAGAMSTADKTKLNTVEDNAEENIIEEIQIAGVALSTANKIVNIPIAASNVNGAMSSADKTKLDGIEAGASANILEGVQVNGTDLPITNKKVNVDLTGYVEKTDIVADFSTAVPSNGKVADAKGIQDYVNEKVQLHFVKLTKNQSADIYYVEDPTTQAITIYHKPTVTPATNAIYLVPDPGTPTTFIEYFYEATSDTFEEFGRTSMDLSNYAQYSDFSTISTTEVINLWNTTP